MTAVLLLTLLQATPDAGAAAQPTPPAPTPAAAPKKVVKKKPKGPPAPQLVLYHVNRRETLVLKPSWKYQFPDGSQHKFNVFMRCHHTNRRHAMAPRLMRMLAEVSRHFGNKRVLVVAGYRAPVAARNPKSPHKKGLAADFRVDGVSNQELRDWCRANFQRVGVGYYPNSSFVHLDVRNHENAFWIDYSGPDEAPLYSRTPEEDIRTGRADSFKPGKIGEGSGESEEGQSPPETNGTVGQSPQSPATRTN